MKKVILTLLLVLSVTTLFAKVPIDYRSFGGRLTDLSFPESIIANEDGSLEIYPTLSDAAEVDTRIVFSINDEVNSPIGELSVEIPRGNATPKKGFCKFKNKAIKAGSKYHIEFKRMNTQMWSD